MSTLLPFHHQILTEINDPGVSNLLILARGLGLRRIICTLLKIYDSPDNLILLVNATPEEELEIGEELGIMGCRKPGLRVVGYETSNKERQALYKKGGLISVTSRILIVDMLKSDIPIDLITGIMVFHAERVNALSLEAFIVRLYREKNKIGFLKAFTDQPEHITSGMSPLKNIMKELQVRSVHIYPRFQELVKQSLERRKADVVELGQNMTDYMSEIHHAIIQCMQATLNELKRSNTSLDTDDFNVENAYFRSFELVVRRQLDAVWHKVGPRTKQLVNDLATLRSLLYYLMTYDALQFHAYLETLIAANNTSVSGGPKQHQPLWMMSEAANVIFQAAKRRCYIVTAPAVSAPRPPPVIDLVDDEDAWQALDEVHGQVGTSVVKPQIEQREYRPSWLPEGMEPTLEELPKWQLLADVLQEIESEIIRLDMEQKARKIPIVGTDTVLVMTSSTRSANTITEYLSVFDHDAPSGAKGRKMMMNKLHLYLWWKGKMSEKKGDGTSRTSNGQKSNQASGSKPDEGISEALKKKDRERAEKAASRRRVRGGAPPAAVPSDRKNQQEANRTVMAEIKSEADNLANFWAGQTEAVQDEEDVTILNFESGGLQDEFDTNYGLLAPQETVIVRAYGEDGDDRLLAEFQPRFIVMFEPNMEFIRRIEVYRSANPGLAVRVYHLTYRDSCEEYKYLAAIRREKSAFENLIKERGSMLLPIFDDTRQASNDSMIKTISSRLAGGRRELSKGPSQVVVDMREFRSTLPSLLHAANMLVVPATLTVGDYILTPDICVERKSLADLVSSFNSGRLYTQCEMMSVYYKNPVLLIEFEEDKAFNLEIISDLKNYAKPTGNYPAKRRADPESTMSIQSKIVLLTLTFPRVRIIWSSSPYATAEIFKEFKTNSAEPDPEKAVAIGAEEDPEAGAGINTAAEELLRCLPGITAKNVKWVMGKVKSVREFCEMDLKQVQDILGVEPGKACWEFMHKGEKGVP
ncbi:hypothetical protein AX16_005734 [Volvariella volvacea WC 439]|nr:hypothetical protein AX16_005734 [Volvariella volvacea WC 439]